MFFGEGIAEYLETYRLGLRLLGLGLGGFYFLDYVYQLLRGGGAGVG